MNRILLTALACFVIILTSCNSKHLITDTTYRQTVESKYSEREAMYGKRSPELFSAVKNETDLSKKEAMQFLIAYMPLNDIADFDLILLEKSVERALEAREKMPWGNTPVSLFLSFVLPPRVNNENLDSFRIVYYDEITKRVAGLSAREAALEINHWCHEKVAYQPSDSRTSSPLATILSARGRCGEESTFTVSALRTAGIPARQVYTPRWAHTDDNHAWVEVWIDGQWYYLGACEPEPVLDRGWFTEPARRAMLIHTKAFGNYSGDELVIKRNIFSTEINTLSEYAVTKNITVIVTDSTDAVVTGAAVDFLLYNYAELYPIASVMTDEKGCCNFNTGLGDLVIWAHQGDNFDFSHVTISETDTLRLKIKNQHLSGTKTFDLKAPVARNPLPGPDAELVRINGIRVSREDSIRNAYISSWISPAKIDSIASITALDRSTVKEIISRSMGNYRTVSDFLTGSGEKAPLALLILKNISEKDLRDADGIVLRDHLINMPEKPAEMSNEVYDRFVLSPRVSNEKLSAWRSQLKKLLPSALLEQFKADPLLISSWIDSAIVINDDENFYKVPLTPGGVTRLRIADAHSAKIFYVALCRTLGIPARFEPGTNRPQYFSSGKWTDVWFKNDSRPATQKSYITFSSKEKSPVPEYYSHFTLARFNNGVYRTLEFDENLKPDEMPKDIPLDPGRYMLFTGNRINDVTILTEASFFELVPGEHKTLEVSIRDEVTSPEVIANIDFKRSINALDGTTTDLSTLSGKGIVALWIKPGTEPTRHIFADIPLLKEEFDQWGGYFIFFIDPSSEDFDPSQYKGLPENTIFAFDKDLTLFAALFPDKDPKNAQFPVIFYSDDKGNVLYFSEGYKIGIGDQIIKRIN